MQVATACPHCSVRFQVSQSVMGKRTRCTKCGEPFVLTESPAIQAAPSSRPKKVPASTSVSFGTIGKEEAQASDDVTHAPPIPPSPPAFEIEDKSDVEINPVRRGRDTSNSTSRNYFALRFIARTLEFLALIFVALLILYVAIRLREYSQYSGPLRQDIYEVLFNIFGAVLAVALVDLTLFFIANVIRLGIQIERNTYTSQDLLKRLSIDRDLLLKEQSKNDRAERPS